MSYYGFLSQEAMAAIKKDDAARNSRDKRGEHKRPATAQHVICGCGDDTCHWEADWARGLPPKPTPPAPQPKPIGPKKTPQFACGECNGCWGGSMCYNTSYKPCGECHNCMCGGRCSYPI